jgi:hypothetical protein
MQPQDRLEILSNLRTQGVDITQQLIAPMVEDVVGYANLRDLKPSEDTVPEAVNRFVPAENKKFFAVLNNGNRVQITPQMFQEEALYNALPIRYKTWVL